MNKYARKRNQTKKIAQERIQILENLIKKEPENPYNNRYKDLITKLEKKYKAKNK